jgi:hypothetical protein
VAVPGGGLAARRTPPSVTRPAPKRPPLVAAAAVAPAATTDDLRVPSGVLFLFVAAFLFLLVTAAVALVPSRALPARLSVAVGRRREQLLFLALCSVGVGFAIVLLVALASA